MISGSSILWEPQQSRIGGSALWEFLNRINRNHTLQLNSYHELHQWSIENLGLFWSEVAEFCGIHWIAPPQQSFVPPPPGKMRGAQWFVGGTLNFAQNLLQSLAVHSPAIVAAAEGHETPYLISPEELTKQVAAAARGFLAAGVGPGDRVAAVTSNTPEAIVAMLGAAAIGAIWSSCSPDFGVQGILDRFSQIEPKVLLATTAYQYNGQSHLLDDTLHQVVAGLPSLKLVLRTNHLKRGDASDQWTQWLLENLSDEGVPYAELPFDHPLYIMFSSGTTGVPKCIVHGAGGTLLQHKKELMLHCDLRPGDRLAYFTTCGWMMWNWMVSGLSVGATLTLFEGSPAYPEVTRLWEFVAAQQVTHFGTSPKYLQATAKAGIAPATEFDLSALRCLLSTGSPLLPEQFDWVYQSVKKDLHLSSISGGTDIISCFMLGNLLMPVRRGEIQAPGLGMAIASWNDKFEPVTDEKGELVCTEPFPSMPLYFWHDEENKLYDQAYFDYYKDLDREVWRHGDYIAITANFGIIVYGRSDATLNPGGVRIGTAEIYRQVERLAEVQDCICAAKQTGDDTAIALFVQLTPGSKWDDFLADKIRRHIREQLTPRHVPKFVVPVTGIPYTRSGKKVEVAVNRAINGEPVANASAISNPEQLAQYIAWGKSLV